MLIGDQDAFKVPYKVVNLNSKFAWEHDMVMP
jgi:hypothetical protein